MHRFYIETVNGDEAALTDEQLHHLRDVLRLRVGDEILVFDSKGSEYTGLITGVDKSRVALKVIPIQPRREKQTRTTLACAIPRGKAMDDIVDYLTQLGADVIIPMLTERVVARPDAAASEARRARWQKIALSAARQSQRNGIPRIEPVTGIAEVISGSGDYDFKVIPTLDGGKKSLKDIITGNRPKNILITIGPEGDFTPEEVRLALRNGFIPVSLGETILRVPTAAIAVMSYIKLALDD